MPSFDLIALRCPSCGATSSSAPRAASYGAEIRCDHCQAVSILVINQNLVPMESLQRSGEKVCAECGQVAMKEARFCQQGHPLVRACLACAQEFPAHHQRCDFCGRVQLEVQLEQALARIQELEAERIAPERVPVPGLTADQLRQEITKLQHRQKSARRGATVLKVVLILLSLGLLTQKEWVQIPLCFIGWKVFSGFTRHSLAKMDESLARHTQAVAVVERNTRIDLEVAELQRDIAGLRLRMA